MNKLLVRSKDIEKGVYQEVTPAAAGWKLLNFNGRVLEKGETWAGNTLGNEYAIVLMGGAFSVKSSRGEWRTERSRKDVFSGLPHAVYLPRNTEFALTAESAVLDIACGFCPAEEDFPARLITPEDVDRMGIEFRGGDNASRQINSILPPGSACHRLVCVEVYTPSGNWSSFPSHKHDARKVDENGNLVEACLEETYFYKLDKPQGFAVQRVYTGDGELDELNLAQNNDVVLVPRGYHPVAAGHGYHTYYLNFLAGSDQALTNTDDPDHEWIYHSWKGLDPRLPIVTLDMNK